MKVTVAKIEPWATSRRSRPWLAVLSLDGEKLVYSFRNEAFEGTDSEGGVLVAELEEGDYVAWGQKDFLGSSSYMWMGIYENGALREMDRESIVSSLRSRQGR